VGIAHKRERNCGDAEAEISASQPILKDEMNFSKTAGVAAIVFTQPMCGRL
jgi:hypothetical protein